MRILVLYTMFYERLLLAGSFAAFYMTKSHFLQGKRLFFVNYYSTKRYKTMD